MFVADIIKRVRDIAGDTTALQFTDETVLHWINDGIRECAINNNLLQKTGTVNMVPGQFSYDLPVDIFRLHSIKYNGAKLRLMTLQEWENVSQNEPDSGTPVGCYLWAGKIVLSAKPEKALDKLSIEYTYNPGDLLLANVNTDSPPIPSMYHNRLVDYCLAQVAQQDDDMNRYQMKLNEFITGVKELKDKPEQELDVYPSMTYTDGYY